MPWRIFPTLVLWGLSWHWEEWLSVVELGRGVGLSEGLGLDVRVWAVEGEHPGHLQPVGRDTDHHLGL